MNEFQWITDIKPFNMDIIMEHNNNGKVVAQWFGDMSKDLMDVIEHYITSHGYTWVWGPYFSSQHNGVLSRLRNGEIMAITFYPTKKMGHLKNGNSWHSYISCVNENRYADMSCFEITSPSTLALSPNW